jgi:cytochrome c oxidase assembly protein subunit 15
LNGVDLSPALRLLLLAGGLALLPLSWWWLRQRNADWRARLAALCALTLFLTFDLIIFGAFTRLSDSGLGCPDWPGCYGHASPLGASAHIDAAQQALPSGPVTLSKAWIEMIHRYLAMTVGVLIVVMTVAGWARRRASPHSAWWPTVTLAWVLVQGLFGKYTVTLKLYPAIVTLHLLGGMVLLALLTVQYERFRDRPVTISVSTRRATVAVLALLGLQLALGGWVSSNYAVLACSGFPQCNGQWWPDMDFGAGFTLLRELGRLGQGEYLPVDALVAIHYAHRAFAVVVLAALAWLAWRLWPEPSSRGCAKGLAALAALQLASGLSNVVLGWPLAAALLHTAGAAALVWVLCSLWARAHVSPPAAQAGGSAPAAQAGGSAPAAQAVGSAPAARVHP